VSVETCKHKIQSNQFTCQMKTKYQIYEILLYEAVNSVWYRLKEGACISIEVSVDIENLRTKKITHALTWCIG
jgi:hypothetical protein